MFTKPSRLVDRVFLHCSASDHASHDNVATMRKWHLERGWSDVGYHLFIRKNGQLEAGRSLDLTPAAQSGHNKGTIAICLHGLKIENFTAAQFDTLRALCIEINNAYDGKLTFHGHREVASKACPVFDYKTVLKLDSFGRLGLTGASVQPLVSAPAGSTPTSMPVLRRGARGETVALMQRLLMVKDDGIFGPKTDTAVRDFQTANGLGRDGIVGQATWTALFAAKQVEHGAA